MTFKEAQEAYRKRFKEGYPLLECCLYDKDDEKEIVKEIEEALRTGTPVKPKEFDYEIGIDY